MKSHDDWKKIPEEFPDKREHIWLSNGEKIHLWEFTNYDALAKAFDGKWIYWKPLEKPELPDLHSLHFCVHLASFFSCYEDFNGILFIRFKNSEIDICRQCAFCPFCGYSPEKEKE